MSHRFQTRFREILSPVVRRLSAMLSRRVRGAMGAELRPEMLGRVAADGDQERDAGDSFQPVGLVARPAGSVVESICAFIGADSDHPVEIATLDHGRRAVIDACGLDTDETLAYTQRVALKLTAAGRALIGAVEQFADISQFHSVVVKVEYDEHTHPLPAGEFNGTIGGSPASGTITFTDPTGEPDPASETVLRVAKE